MENVVDIFNQDPFSNISLTGWVNSHFPFIPGLLTNMGLFNGEGVYTKYVAFDEVNGTLRMISTSPRGAPPSQSGPETGSTRVAEVVHFAREAEINADELLAIRASGGLTAQTAEQLVQRRVDGPVGLRNQWGATKEHLYLGAIQGIVYDSDGLTELYNWYTYFGVSAPAAIEIDYTGMADDSAVLQKTGTTIRRTMVKELQGMPTGGAVLVALAGDNFYDVLTQSKEYVQLRKLGDVGNRAALQAVTLQQPYDSVEVGGVIYINYRGSDDGLIAIDTDEARVFMRGVPGLFQEFYAPADTFETVSAAGLPLYLLQRPERQSSSRRVFELQTNPLILCSRPKSLLRITKKTL